MDIVERKLTEGEEIQLDLAQVFHQNRVSRSLNYRNLLLKLVIGLGMVYLSFYTDGDFKYLLRFVAFMFPIFIYVDIHNWMKDRKISRRVISEIAAIKESDYIRVQRFKVSRVAVFDNFEEEGNLYLFEVGDSLLFSWIDQGYFIDRNLIKSDIEIYQIEESEMIFGQRLLASGDSVTLLRIPSDLKWSIYDWLPEKGDRIVGKSMMQFLGEIKEKLQES